MAIPVEARAALDRTIARRTAAAALRSIHSLIREGADEERSARRSAGMLTAMLLGLSVVLLLVHAAVGMLGAERPAPPDEGAFTFIALLSFLACVPLAIASGLSRPGTRSLHRCVAIGGVVAAVIALFLVDAVSFTVRITGCPQAYSASRNNRYGDAIEAASRCLAFPGLVQSERAYALRLRAWAYGHMGETEKALRDLDTAFRLPWRIRYDDWQDYSLALEEGGRFEDSLDVLARIDTVEPARMKPSLQIRKGWLLFRLARYDQAIEASTRLIARRPGRHAGAYCNRGMAYDALGESTRAAEDLERCGRLLMAVPPETRLASEYIGRWVRPRLVKYGLVEKYPV